MIIHWQPSGGWLSRYKTPLTSCKLTWLYCQNTFIESIPTVSFGVQHSKKTIHKVDWWGNLLKKVHSVNGKLVNREQHFSPDYKIWKAILEKTKSFNHRSFVRFDYPFHFWPRTDRPHFKVLLGLYLYYSFYFFYCRKFLTINSG